MQIIQTQFETTTIKIFKTEGQDTCLIISFADGSTCAAYLSAQQTQELIETLKRQYPRRRRPKQSRKNRRRDMIPLDRFAAMHNVAPLDVTRAINMQVLKPDEIEQKDGTTILMLDSEGRRAFWECLHDAAMWMDCPICPHELY